MKVACKYMQTAGTNTSDYARHNDMIIALTYDREVRHVRGSGICSPLSW